jgi:hypothetical protein
LNIDDVIPDPAELVFSPIGADRVRVIWPQARYELLAFARYLGRNKSPITADHIRLAVQLADKAFAAEFEAEAGGVIDDGR